jgi:hypothetical protein
VQGDGYRRQGDGYRTVTITAGETSESIGGDQNWSEDFIHRVWWRIDDSAAPDPVLLEREVRWRDILPQEGDRAAVVAASLALEHEVIAYMTEIGRAGWRLVTYDKPSGDERQTSSTNRTIINRSPCGHYFLIKPIARRRV